MWKHVGPQVVYKSCLDYPWNTWKHVGIQVVYELSASREFPIQSWTSSR